MARKPEAAPVTMTGGIPDAYLAARDVAMHRLDIGTTHDMHSAVTGVVLPSLFSRAYTTREKIRLWRGKARSGVSPMWEQMLATDLNNDVPALELPAYFLHGIYDYTCSYTEARSFFEHLKAPVKGFYTFEQSAHSPLFEEPEKTLHILRQDVLAGTNRLADAHSRSVKEPVHL